MGTIVARKRKDGTTAYLAKISLMRAGKLYRENQTFERRPVALAWIAKREEELAKPGAIERAKQVTRTLADAIDKFTDESLKDIGRRKRQVFRTIKTYAIADLPCEEITSAELVGFATELSKGGMKPQTIIVYMAYLSGLFAIARAAWGFPFIDGVTRDALRATKRLGLTRSGDKRTRRPTLDELNKIMATYAEREKHYKKMAPMTKIVPFAIFSTRRQDEIARITWDDFEEENSRVLVRDMKDPTKKAGNDIWCDLPPQAVAIIKSMPKTDDRIFPYSAHSMSVSFTRVCEALEIEDLHFHDLRHDGVSRLFELDYSIPRAAAVSGHRSWQSLKRYTHLRQTGDKYKDWKWLADQPQAEEHKASTEGEAPEQASKQDRG